MLGSLPHHIQVTPHTSITTMPASPPSVSTRHTNHCHPFIATVTTTIRARVWSEFCSSVCFLRDWSISSFWLSFSVFSLRPHSPSCSSFSCLFLSHVCLSFLFVHFPVIWFLLVSLPDGHVCFPLLPSSPLPLALLPALRSSPSLVLLFYLFLPSIRLLPPVYLSISSLIHLLFSITPPCPSFLLLPLHPPVPRLPPPLPPLPLPVIGTAGSARVA